MKQISIALLAAVALASCMGEPAEEPEANKPRPKTGQPSADQPKETVEKDPRMMTDEEWKKKLTPEQYHILRKKGTERPGTGKYEMSEDIGTYICAGCDTDLFTSDQKYHSGCGWPAFSSPFSGDHIELKADNTLGMKRTEVLCKKCGGHLGHVFNDGPPPTGQRYCINSGALKFRAAEKKEK